MSDDYTPPKVWTWDAPSGGAFANINRPVAGATHEATLPVGAHPFQLYSLATPNGQKVSIMFEELLAAGVTEAEYDAWFIDISKGDQFGSDFVDINPNSKIPALMDRSSDTPVRVFESGAILVYLAEKFGMFLPSSGAARAECMSWLMWQMGSAPFLGGGFGHFYHYAPVKIEYAINRYAMEAKRLFDVANRRLADSRFLAGEDYTIADIATYTWIGNFMRGEAYNDAATFLSCHEYEHVQRWVAEIDPRPGVLRGRLVNNRKGLIERHNAADFDTLPPEVLNRTVKGF
ncbi:glutathione-dependent disulfide-bond oxidoreductase [Novosphingobium sp. FSY-8]|uniref:Glutathione-dependent disulfide-bond oxidoreductase n=1 Tax=Novosphingobium ovatum TaxID=1908523 RepID=A0ABW9XAB4_9SPHN|nr:glutathione-dependent disulfide-bond oxidoreductase [Novosphingobium ovatum]NBC35466.1 glutathione-dependent disulfide-bond oxidoreductase [Novosphingobium ovatum]